MISESAIQALYKAIAPKLTNYLVANGSEYAAACDIVQEAFLRLWKKREDFSGTDSISAFLFAVARNLKIDRFRRNRFYVFQEEIAEGDMGLAEPERLQDDVGYLRKRLQQALAQLSDDLRNTYTLLQIGKQSIKQIAAETGASESLVKVRIHRAKQKLQELLADLQEK